MSNGRAVTLIVVFGEFERNDGCCAYENMALLISIRIVWATFHESVLDFIHSSLVK
jgi:hypothetical protein